MQEEKKRQKSNSFLIDYLVGDNFITEFREQPAQASPAVDVEDPMVSLVLGCPFGAIGQEVSIFLTSYSLTFRFLIIYIFITAPDVSRFSVPEKKLRYGFEQDFHLRIFKL